MAADGWSPHLQMTGSWADASQRLAAARLGRQWRPFRVAQAVDESSTIRSLYLEPADGMATVAPLAGQHLPGGPRGPPLAGQHLPLRLMLADGSHLQRTYTLSLAPSDGRLRISVKRQGRASRSEEHTSELQSQSNLVCRLLLEKKKNKIKQRHTQPTPVL